MGLFDWLFSPHEEQTKPKVGMSYNEIARILGQGYNHTQFGDRDYYLFMRPGEHDYTIAFQRGKAVDIKEFRKDPNQIYGA